MKREEKKSDQKLFVVVLGLLFSLWIFTCLTLVTKDSNYLQASTVYSNFFLLPAVYEILYQIIFKNKIDLSIDFIVTILTMYASTVYHLHDQRTISKEDVLTLGINFEILQRLDFTVSFYLIMLWPFAWSQALLLNGRHKVLRVLILLVTFPFAFHAGLKENRFGMEGLAFTGGGIFLGLIFFIGNLVTFCKHHQKKQKLRTIIPLCEVSFDIFFKAVAVIGNYVLKLDETYEITHSFIWHLPAFLSFYFTYRGVRKMNENVRNLKERRQ